MFAFLEPGVDIDRKIILVKIRHLLHELEMFSRDLAFDQATEAIQIFFRIRYHRLTRVLLKSASSASDRRYPQIARTFNKVEQHLFVVSAQANNVLRIILNAFQHIRNTARSIRTAVDQVAKEDQQVNFFVTRNHFHEVPELRATAMNVTDDESF